MECKNIRYQEVDLFGVNWTEMMQVLDISIEIAWLEVVFWVLQILFVIFWPVSIERVYKCSHWVPVMTSWALLKPSLPFAQFILKPEVIFAMFDREFIHEQKSESKFFCHFA